MKAVGRKVEMEFAVSSIHLSFKLVKRFFVRSKGREKLYSPHPRQVVWQP